MRNEPMRRNDLPETCFSILPSSGQLIIIRCGERGYADLVLNGDVEAYLNAVTEYQTYEK